MDAPGPGLCKAKLHLERLIKACLASYSSVGPCDIPRGPVPPPASQSKPRGSVPKNTIREEDPERKQGGTGRSPVAEPSPSLQQPPNGISECDPRGQADKVGRIGHRLVGDS